MHHTNAKVVGVVGVADLHLLAVHVDLAFLGLVQTEQNTHQRGLTGAILTQQSVDLALFQLEGNVVVGNDTGEALGDVQHLNCVVFQLPYLLKPGGSEPLLWPGIVFEASITWSCRICKSYFEFFVDYRCKTAKSCQTKRRASRSSPPLVKICILTSGFLLNAQGNPNGSPAHTPSFRFRHGSDVCDCKRRASFRSPFRVM